MVHNAADAEDIFQQTSVTLWKKFPEFDRNRDFHAWACGVAFRDVQNFRRLAIHRRVKFNDDVIRTLADEQISSSFRNRYQLELLEECISHLKESDNQIIASVYRDEKAVQEIAERMGKATQTIYNRLNIIRHRLLECINRKMDARGGIQAE